MIHLQWSEKWESWVAYWRACRNQRREIQANSTYFNRPKITLAGWRASRSRSAYLSRSLRTKTPIYISRFNSTSFNRPESGRLIQDYSWLICWLVEIPLLVSLQQWYHVDPLFEKTLPISIGLTYYLANLLVDMLVGLVGLDTSHGLL